MKYKILLFIVIVSILLFSVDAYPKKRGHPSRRGGGSGEINLAGMTLEQPEPQVIKTLSPEQSQTSLWKQIIKQFFSFIGFLVCLSCCCIPCICKWRMVS